MLGTCLARMVRMCDGNGDGVGVLVFWDVIVISVYLLGFGIWILERGVVRTNMICE